MRLNKLRASRLIYASGHQELQRMQEDIRRSGVPVISSPVGLMRAEPRVLSQSGVHPCSDHHKA